MDLNEEDGDEGAVVGGADGAPDAIQPDGGDEADVDEFSEDKSCHSMSEDEDKELDCDSKAVVQVWLHSKAENAPIRSVVHEGETWFVGKPGEEFTVRAQITDVDFRKVDLDIRLRVDGVRSGLGEAWYSDKSRARCDAWYSDNSSDKSSVSDAESDNEPQGRWDHETDPRAGQPLRVEFDGWNMASDRRQALISPFQFCTVPDADSTQEAQAVANASEAGRVCVTVWKARILWNKKSKPDTCTPDTSTPPQLPVAPNQASAGDDKKWFELPGLATGRGSTTKKRKLDDIPYKALCVLGQATVRYDLECNLQHRGVLPLPAAPQDASSEQVRQLQIENSKLRRQLQRALQPKRKRDEEKVEIDLTSD